MNANIIARIANVTRIANNTVVNNIVSSAKEHNTMNPFVTLIRRAAKTLGLVALLAVSHAAVQAQVVVNRWVGPGQALGVPANSTIMQIKVSNTSSFTVSGIQIFTNLYTPGFADFTGPSSSVFSLGPNQSEWINVTIPAKGIGGTPLYGLTLNGTAWLGVHQQNQFSVSFKDVAPAPNLQIGQITPPANDNPGTTFTAVVTNNGYAASQAQTISGSIWANADGRVSPYYPLSGTVPVLQIGQSAKVTFSLPTIMTYDNTGYDDLMGYLTLGSQTINFTF